MGKHKHCECYIHEHKENIRLKRIIKEKDGELGQKDKAIEQLSSENAELKKKLQYYENPNSPPSSNSLLWKQLKKERREEKREGNCEPKKLGRMTIKEYRIKPTETIEHTMDRCKECGSSEIGFSYQECRTIVDVPESEPYAVLCPITVPLIMIYSFLDNIRAIRSNSTTMPLNMRRNNYSKPSSLSKRLQFL